MAQVNVDVKIYINETEVNSLQYKNYVMLKLGLDIFWVVDKKLSNIWRKAQHCVVFVYYENDIVYSRAMSNSFTKSISHFD